MSDEPGTYLICFDFPEMPDPLFAGWLHDGALGFAPTIKTAARFDNWEAAERTIKNSYGGETGRFASVVEVEVLNLDDVTWTPGPSERVEWH